MKKKFYHRKEVEEVQSARSSTNRYPLSGSNRVVSSRRAVQIYCWTNGGQSNGVGYERLHWELLSARC